MIDSTTVVINEYVRVGDLVYAAPDSGEVFWVKKDDLWEPWVKTKGTTRNREMYLVRWLNFALRELKEIPILEVPDDT